MLAGTSEIGAARDVALASVTQSNVLRIKDHVGQQ